MFCCCAVDEAGGLKIHSLIGNEELEVLHEEPCAYETYQAQGEQRRPSKTQARADRGGQRDQGGAFALVAERPETTTSWGLKLDPSGSRNMYVKSLDPGLTPVQLANARAPVDERLREGDFIVSVNGLEDDLYLMMLELQSKTKLEMQVRRPFEFDIDIDAAAGSLGCGISYDVNTGASLVIESISDGAVSAWNKAHFPFTVQVNDRIIGVNGKRGTSTDLLDLIRSLQGWIRLRMSRPVRS